MPARSSVALSIARSAPEAFRDEAFHLGGVEVAPATLILSSTANALPSVAENGAALQYVRPTLRTPQICLAAVSNVSYTPGSFALQYVKSELRTPELYLSAVTQNGAALELVKPELRTQELCLAAVTQCGDALRYVPRELRTLEVCLAAVNQNGAILSLIKHELLTPEVYLAAVKSCAYALHRVPPQQQTPELCLAAVTRDGCALRYVRPSLRTRELCLSAVKRDGYALRYVPCELFTPEICLAAVTHDARSLFLIPRHGLSPDDQARCLESAIVAHGGSVLRSLRGSWGDAADLCLTQLWRHRSPPLDDPVHEIRTVGVLPCDTITLRAIDGHLFDVSCGNAYRLSGILRDCAEACSVEAVQLEVPIKSDVLTIITDFLTRGSVNELSLTTTAQAYSWGRVLVAADYLRMPLLQRAAADLLLACMGRMGAAQIEALLSYNERTDLK